MRLINDFAAMGYGLLTLKPHEYIVLNDAPKEEGAPIATIGAGTGLGECYLTAGNDGQYSCFACEGGHTDFAPANKLEIEIYEDIKKKVRLCLVLRLCAWTARRASHWRQQPVD